MQKVHAITVILITYWVITTVRMHFTPRLHRATRANVYDLGKDNPDVQRAAQRKRGPLKAAGWALRIAGWVENALLALAVAYFAVMVGGLISGTVFVFGKPL